MWHLLLGKKIKNSRGTKKKPKNTQIVLGTMRRHPGSPLGPVYCICNINRGYPLESWLRSSDRSKSRRVSIAHHGEGHEEAGPGAPSQSLNISIYWSYYV